jgi:predicted nucleic acid-binding protein
MEMTDVDRLFVDTNILIYATNEASPWYAVANAALRHARQLGVELILSTQVLREYLAAATRPASTGKSIPLQKILENFETFPREFTVVEGTKPGLAFLASLLRTIPLGGKQVHDANIVATMLAHNIPTLLTHNADDFTRFSSLITILPLETKTP